MSDQGWGKRAAREDEDTGAPRVLVENDDHALLWATERVLARAGYDVAGCPGPDADRKELPSGRCLMTRGGSCPLAEGADVVIFGLDMRRDSSRKVLSSWRSRGSQRTPLVLDGSVAGSSFDHALTDGYERIGSYATTSELIASVERARQTFREGSQSSAT